MEKIKIVIADNSFLLRQGLKSLIEETPGLILGGEAETAEELDEKLLLAKPDLLIIDYTSPSFCVDDILVIRENFPAVSVLAVTYPQAKEIISKVIENGITGHLLKSCDKEEILEAIQATARGQKYFCGKIVDALVQKTESNPRSISCGGLKLSDREIEIIRLIASGLANKQIAGKLFISAHTVTTHRKNIMSKIGVNNTASLVMFAIRQKLVPGSVPLN